MLPENNEQARRQHLRRELIRKYVALQRELVDADPSSSSYQSLIQNFRKMGYVLITSGFEGELDRLLRIRVLDGGRAEPAPIAERQFPDELHIVERREVLL